jgi:hypothetical protein
MRVKRTLPNFFDPLENNPKSGLLLERENCTFSEKHKATAALFNLDGNRH